MPENRPRRFHLILNPAGGNGDGLQLLDSIKPIFNAAKAEIFVHETECNGHAVDLVRALKFDGYDGIIAVGGDGTAHEVINGVLTHPSKKKLPVGILPAGSGNSFLYGFDIRDMETGAQRLLAADPRKIDIAKVAVDGTIQFSFNIIGWGMVAAVSKTAIKWRRFPKQRYNIATVIELIRLKARPVTLELADGTTISEDILFLIACNTPYTGVGMKMAPNAELDDGKIDILLVRDASRIQLLRLFGKVFNGEHIDSPLVEYYQTTGFRLSTEDSEELDMDGELTGHTPIDVEVMSKALDVLVYQ